VRLTKFAGIPLLLWAAAGWHASAQSWDSSGNGLLKGTYYFREVLYFVGYNDGSLQEASALYGSITFSGTGTYTCQVSLIDSSAGLETGTLSGTYSIAASGYGSISNPLSNGDYVYGLVNSAGIFVGSTTETTVGFNDLFIAAPLASPAPTAGSFKGTYTIAGIDLSSGSPSSTLGYLLQMNPDGVSALGTVSGVAYSGGSGSSKYPQSFTGSKYIASSGAMVVTFPNSTSNVVTGQKYVYISPDGNFIFGGSPQSFDMFVGVRNGSGASLGGLYYQAGLDQDASQLASADFANLDTYYGSFSAGGNNIVGHQRLFSVFNGSAYDYTYADSYSTPSNTGSYNTPLMSYFVGAGGVRIGSGIGPYLGINVALPAPSFTGSGVYLNPTGIVNAASSAPFTAGVSPGELLTLYGTNLADSTVIAPAIPFPNTLGNVQVMINGIAAPIYYVAPTQVSVIVPYEITAAVVQVQVVTDGNPSNTVTEFLNTTSAGVFSVPPGGLGDGAVLHQDGSLVTPANPAQANETVSVFLTGLGPVNPTISDGAAGPVSPLSQSVSTITAYIGGTQGTVTYSGLAPQLAGLYQVNVTVPTGLTAGENDLDIAGPDSYTSQVSISVGGSATADSAAQARSRARRPPPRIGKALVRPSRLSGLPKQ
jgi:uncharacterized protein (TIGR03437 family)